MGFLFLCDRSVLETLCGPVAYLTQSNSTIRPLPLRRWRRRCMRGRKARPQTTQENQAMDIAVLAITAIFFALALTYVAICDKL